MLTLDRWREFAFTPRTLKFPNLRLIGHDSEPPIAEGSGEVRMDSPETFSFSMSGAPPDTKYALEELNRRRLNPYEPLARFRLLGVDDEGRSWNGGWTLPAVSISGSEWIFRGELDGLGIDDTGVHVSQHAGVELIYLLRVGDPMTLRMSRYAHTGEVEVVGSKIKFVYEASSGTMLVTASSSADFGAPYAENWISEPLRILFGQLIFPRLVARNSGGGRAWVSIRRSPGLVRGAGWAALWEKEQPADDALFWTTYGRLLGFIVRAHDGGHPNFEANALTRFYEECIQAARGSRWVWALTFASSIEGLAKMIAQNDANLANAASPSDEERTSIAALIKYIRAWPGNDDVKRMCIGALPGGNKKPTAGKILKALRSEGVINDEQLRAWNAVRHHVTHGNLLPIYSSKEGDAQLLALASLMHALTRRLLTLVPS